MYLVVFVLFQVSGLKTWVVMLVHCSKFGSPRQKVNNRYVSPLPASGAEWDCLDYHWWWHAVGLYVYNLQHRALLSTVELNYLSRDVHYCATATATAIINIKILHLFVVQPQRRHTRHDTAQRSTGACRHTGLRPTSAGRPESGQLSRTTSSRTVYCFVF